MFEIITEIDILASPARVWRALTDFQSYPQWNPVIRSLEGIATEGQNLKVIFGRDGHLKLKFHVTVIACVLNKEFRWMGRLLLPVIFAGDHYFQILELAPHRSKLVHGERFSGILKPIIWLLLSKYNESAFIAMNQALKTYVEGNAIFDTGEHSVSSMN